MGEASGVLMLRCETAIRFRSRNSVQCANRDRRHKRGTMILSRSKRGGEVMPLNEIPRHFNPETRNLIEAALEDAWQELNKDDDLEAAPARNKLRTTN